jgi:RNA polymerase sigma-70 factor (ECF subfamily)
VAFERLYRRHVGRVHSVVRRLIGDGDADEMTQDVFVRAWEKLHTFRGDAAFGTWLHRLAVNLTLSRRSQAARLRARFVVLEALPSRAVHAAPAGLRMDFEQAMGALPEGARQVFVLHDVEGFKHEEIAKLLGVATGTSKSQLHRARMELRKWLS